MVTRHLKNCFSPGKSRLPAFLLLGGTFTFLALCFFSYPVDAPLERFPSRKCNKCNDYEFTYDQSVPITCKSDLFLLILIVSHPVNTSTRTAIRETWGRITSHNDHEIQILFVLGKEKNPVVDQEAKKEAQTHRDIVIIDLAEDYFKLTTKSVATFTWALQNCSQAKYILKTDDDAYNDPRKLVNFLQAQGYPEDLIAGRCCVYGPEGPDRKRGSKWYVGHSEYPWRYFPTFCSGIGYILARRTAEGFVKLAPNVEWFKFEDVYVTGFVRQAYGKDIVQIPHMYLDLHMYKRCYVHEVTIAHHIAGEELRTIWSWVNEPQHRPFYCRVMYDNARLLKSVSILCIVLFGLCCYKFSIVRYLGKKRFSGN